QKNIYDAMCYSLVAGGKRIRPILAYAAGELLNVPIEILEPFAIALEMIHTYSLIHDDLPAMDNDDMRRGMPTCHKKFGEAIAILAGDALLNRAFEIMSGAAVRMIDPLRGLKMIERVAEASGTEGMIGGQVIDLELESKMDVTSEGLKYMYGLKTGALIKAPVWVAIEAADASDTKEAEKLIKYSEKIGFAFQIRDDILDVAGNSKLMGKNTGRDAKENKSTYISIYGLDYCNRLLERITDEAVANADYFGAKGEFLKELAIFLFKREY
ncbi:MAG: polyprenyl synthetase family protein, partial [Clostridiales bacterium]|nr:polyprenyl synthetase family protein [Clostridiales bacterium]